MTGKTVLYWQWNSFLKAGVQHAFSALGLSFDTFFYQLTDWEGDEAFREAFAAALGKKSYDAVFSINFNPMISTICEEKGVPYLSWVYDSPLHIRELAPLKNSVNRIFFFDRGEAEEYRAQGIPAEYLPLAGDIRTFQRVIDTASAADRARYSAEIAFVGKLYQTDYNYYMGPLDEYLRGYLEGIVTSQGKVFGGYIIPNLITDELLDRLNERYRAASGGTASIEKRELTYLLAQEVTARERYLILALLGEHYAVDLYSPDRDERFLDRKNGEHTGVLTHPYVDYETKMPLVFAHAKLNLNISLKCIRTGIPLRVFDILSCGGFCLTNFQAELPEYFELGEEVVCYGSIEEMKALADFYLKNDTERERIAQNGRRRIEVDYTPEKQLAKIFEKIWNLL